MGLAERTRIGAGAAIGLPLVLGALASSSPRYAIALTLALGFVALVIWNLAAGVAAFAVLAVGESVSLIAGSPAIKLAGLILLVASVGRGSAFHLLRERPDVAFAAAFLVAWAIASSTWAPDASIALGSAARFALNIVFLFIVYGAVREQRHARWLLWSFIIAAVATSLYGASSLLAGHVVSDVTGDPNYFASILVSALALAVFAFAGSANSLTKVILATGFTVLAGAVVLTGSRGGLVALAVALLAALALGGTFRRTIGTVVAVVILTGGAYFVFIAPPSSVQHVTHFTAGGGAGREDLWKVAASVAQREPTLGVGAGNFQVVEPSYAAQTINLTHVQQIVDTPNVVHNTYLSLLAELGIPGLLAFLYIAAAALASTAQSIRIARLAQNRELEFLIRGTLVALLALFAAFFFLTGEYQKYLWLFLGLGIALRSIAVRSSRDRRPEPF